MFRAGIFRASGGLGLKSFGPRAGRAFLYRASGFFRAFVKYKIFLKSQKKSSKYIFKKIVIIYAWFSAGIRPEFGRILATTKAKYLKKKFWNFFQ